MLSELPEALAGLRQADRRWHALRHPTDTVPNLVQTAPDPLPQVEWDVAIAGGTLGILLGAALAQAGWRVVLLERGRLQGREQEWNISRRELATFVELDLLSPAELEAAIVSEFNPVRVGFQGGTDLWLKDVLNIGVSPRVLLETLKQRFLQAGGVLIEQTPVESVRVHPNGVSLNPDGSQPIRTRLLLDAMGHFSGIVQQARQGQRPDGVCLVVGTCATGFTAQLTPECSGDLIYSFTPIQNQCQYFWEAFPAQDGRTTYLFTYVDADPLRPSLQDLFEDYFRLLPDYQGTPLEQLTIQRALFGFFPCYRRSPLPPPWSRILPVGDSSGMQSPLSFGGFGAMVRHLERLSRGISAALECDRLQVRDLARLQPYQPSLSVTWLFQKSMSVGMTQHLPPDQINRLLVRVFEAMQELGEPVLKPFLQDVVQFGALGQTLIHISIKHPVLVLQLLPQLGPLALLDWLRHYLNLAAYTALSHLGTGLLGWIDTLPPDQQWVWRCRLDAWTYGSGRDYTHEG
jgi:lycopene cyclase CruP